MRINVAVLIVTVSVGLSVVMGQESQQTSNAGSSSSSSSIDNQGIKSYVLGPGDVVEVRVFGQPDLSAAVQVDSDGNLSEVPNGEGRTERHCACLRKVHQ
jgi:protein involved in polysaccharide export with SLBB domain